MNKYKVVLHCKDKIYNYTISDICEAINVFIAKNLIIKRHNKYHNIDKKKTLIYKI